MIPDSHSCVEMQLGKWQIQPDAMSCTASATTPLGRSLLRNEAASLSRLSGTCAPRLISLHDTHSETRLTREFVSGTALSNLPSHLWSAHVQTLRNHLSDVHAKGVIHGDLKPSNVIINGQDVRLIDWEHAIPIGQPLASWPHRAVSLGYASARQLWAKGAAGADIDLYALEQFGQEHPPKTEQIPHQTKRTTHGSIGVHASAADNR